MWKVLLVISSVVLGGAAWVAYMNMEEAKVKIAEVADQEDLLARRQQSLTDTNAQIAQLEQSIQTLRDETETLGTEKIDLDVRIVEAQSNLRTQESLLADAEAKLENAKTLAEDVSKVENIQREMVQIRTQIEEAEIELSEAEGGLVRAQVERDGLEKVAAELAALRVDQEAGVIRGEFQSTVKAAYNQYGFVVVEGGNDQGVVNRAQLDVYRRGQPICKLLVTSVEPSESAADIIPGSLAPGQTVQVGDMVVRTVRQTTPAEIPAGGGTSVTPGEGTQPGGMEAPAGDMEAPAGDMAPDPFGGGGGMEAPPADSAPDPFGGGGTMGTPAAPAANPPASPSADPPAAPAEGAAPDPFGGGAAMEDAPPAEPAAEPDPFQ